MSSTIASGAPASRLNSALLPTLGRPTIATIGREPRAPVARCVDDAPRARRLTTSHTPQRLAHERLHFGRIVHPIRNHFDPQLQEHLALEQRFHRHARVAADLLDALT